MANSDRSMDAVREILLQEWDPIGVTHNPECSNEYDRYARTVCRFLAEGIDEFRLTSYLYKVETVSMRLPRSDVERIRAVARRLLSLSA